MERKDFSSAVDDTTDFDYKPELEKDNFHVILTMKLHKTVGGRHSHVKIMTFGSAGAQTEAVKEAVEAALAELKGKP